MNKKRLYKNAAFYLLFGLFIFQESNGQTNFPKRDYINSDISKRTTNLNTEPITHISEDEKTTRVVIFEKSNPNDNVTIITRGIDFEEQNFKARFVIKRIVERREKKLNIDTDAPFTSSNMEKSVLNHYIQFIDKPFEITIKDKKKVRAKENVFKSLWDLGFPALHPTPEFSGIFLDMSEEEAWTDTLYFEDGDYINTYRLESQKGDVQSLSLNGTFVPKDKVETNNDENEMLNTEVIEAKVTILNMNYSGKINFDTKKNLIKSLIVETNEKSNIFIDGFSTPRESKSVFTIVNSAK